METTKLLSRGRIVLPSSLRERLDWGAGTELTVEDTVAGVLLRPVKKLAAHRDESPVRPEGGKKKGRRKEVAGMSRRQEMTDENPPRL